MSLTVAIATLDVSLTHGGKTMAVNRENSDGRRARRWRIAAWTAAALILLVPLIAMQFTEEVDWDVADFAIFGALLLGSGVTYELAARKTGNIAYKIAVGIAILAAFLLFWINGAVGLIGIEDNDANLMYHGVVLIGLIGAFVARFEPRGMARAMFATAIAQALVAVIALVAGWGSSGPIWPRGVIGMTAIFVTLWLGSAWLFRRAASEVSPAGTSAEE